MSKGYVDKYGVVWLRISQHYVKRKADGCIGGWFNGDGLTELEAA